MRKKKKAVNVFGAVDYGTRDDHEIVMEDLFFLSRDDTTCTL